MTLNVATKFIMVRPVQSLNTDATIQVLTSIFSEHRLPVGIRCDRGRISSQICFNNIVPILVSPYHIQVCIITVPIQQKGQLGLLKVL